ncbi:cysteine--tRNA ligase [[Clostridium] methylpentosum DSM 5476]|uniref:Cysteine--tRNA ligase n=1 Tax=[Clostridium] methylpentosum DSM 5476 TaxID=537013 RepID=C0ECB4_9FIRM|nr:cysteine--tRNA ligase [[Clostridium] methylpentosum DSM 5476]MDY3989542.1 cysteine--tRNA ligase [Massilioclostridium sp.]MEE1492006.1 cysteine--tRNA ligase [Massilioclostridium sp.]
MKVYNTLTRQKEEFKTIHPNEVDMYACGPTVYNYIHIGNARPIIVFDCLRSYFEFRGYKVKFVQNFTDVDDKIIKKANEEGVEASEISEKYIKEYEKDAKGLNVRPATIHPKVTQSMDMIIDIVQHLVDNGYAYESQGDVYFRTTKFKEYGKLSHMPLEDLEAGNRVEVSDIKEDPMDFAVWKAAKPGEPAWDSPWGKGRPGWHIECSAMATNYLGKTIDLHCGGQDLIFPHHENEIAQSECATGAVFANYWMHNGYINVDNRKMSKSLGNFFTVREVAEKFGYEPIRYMMLQAHYRSPINYNVEVIEQCKASLERMYNFKKNIAFALSKAEDGEFTDKQKEAILARKQQFIDAMEDDFNTADAISAVFELIRDINPLISGETLGSKQHIALAKEIFDELIGVLGLLYNDKEEEIPAEVTALVEQRAAARKEKNFKLADELRDRIGELGYAIEETRQGTKLIKK